MFPYIKQFLVIILILFLIFLITFHIYYATKFAYKTEKNQNIKNDFITTNKNYNADRINLKGRIKRTPNNINYNELFVDNNVKVRKKKEDKTKKENTEEQMTGGDKSNLNDNNCSNLDEFFQRIQEKTDFQKIFNNNEDVKIPIKNNVNVKSHINEDKKVIVINKNTNEKILFENVNDKETIKSNEDLLVFDNKDRNNIKKNSDLLQVEDLFTKHKIISLKEPMKSIPEVENEEKNEEEYECDVSRISNRIKNNSDLYLQTPLARCIDVRKAKGFSLKSITK